MRKAREFRELTQAGLSERTGVPQPTISQLENSLTADGSRYTPRFARAMHVDVDWLADELGVMQPATEVSEPVRHDRARAIPHRPHGGCLC